MRFTFLFRTGEGLDVAICDLDTEIFCDADFTVNMVTVRKRETL